jgi:glycosyltransferase involved in cell wall biosynthesis
MISTPSASSPTVSPPTVSIVIPAYNRSASICPAIESVLAQTWTDFELLVVDDGSTDDTLEQARKVQDPRLHIIESPQNGGAAVARNLGVAQSRGEWIAFQDSDDEWLPTKLEKQMARLLAPGADYVGAYCGMLILGWLDDKPGDRLRVRYEPKPGIALVDGDIVTSLTRGNMISTQTLVVRRDKFLELGPFDADTTPIEDWDFVIKLAQNGQIAFVDEPLVHQRFSPNSITRDQTRAHASRVRLVEKHMDVFARQPKRLALQYRNIGSGYRLKGNMAEARRYLRMAAMLDPTNPRILARTLQAEALSLLGRGSKTQGQELPQVKPGQGL